MNHLITGDDTTMRSQIKKKDFNKGKQPVSYNEAKFNLNAICVNC